MTTRFEKVQHRVHSIAVLTLENPPVNTLARGVRLGIRECVKLVREDRSIAGVIIQGANHTFCAGAEISEFKEKDGMSVSLADVIFELESLEVPVVASIERFALGGGMEVALGAHYRVCAKNASLGLPEVNLGLLPGAGGTQRFPRVCGVQPALQAMVGGIPLRANAAQKINLIDKISDTDAVYNDALNFLAEKIESKDDFRSRRSSARTVSPVPDAVWTETLKMAKRQRRGEIAPENIVKAIKASIELPFDQGMKEEARLFMELAVTPQARALQHMFFAERLVTKVSDGSVAKAKPVDIKSLGIVGAGLMGGGIAMSAVNVGISVVLLDVDQGALDRGLAVIRKNYERSLKRGRLTQAQLDQRMSLIRPTTAYEDFGQVDMVIEAVFEHMDVKKKVFRRLDEVCKPGAFLCTNTSYLDIDEIASATKRPEFVMGTHFFSPANVMKLLENVRGKASSPVTIQTAMQFGKKIKKIPCLVGNCDGFVGNRMLKPYRLQADQLLLEGALPHQIDKVAVEYGMSMGPFQMSDLVGLDLHWRIKKQEGTSDPNTNVNDALCEAGRLGQKSSKGYYTYDENRRPTPDPWVEQTIVNVSKNLNITRRTISSEEIYVRLFYSMINEGFQILDEGIAQRPSDIDVVYCYGYGFPRPRGGPMFYADEVGLNKVVTSLRQYSIEPCSLLLEAASAGSLQKLWATKQKSKL